MTSLPAEFAAAVCAEALSWEGTPFVWQQRSKGGGCDCKGLVWGVAAELGLPESSSRYARMADYGKAVDTRLLREGLGDVFDAVDGEPEPGDVLVLKVGGQPNHLAILASVDRVVLAQIAPADRVKVASLGAVKRRYGIESAWRWKAATAEEWMARMREGKPSRSESVTSVGFGPGHARGDPLADARPLFDAASAALRAGGAALGGSHAP